MSVILGVISTPSQIFAYTIAFICIQLPIALLWGSIYLLTKEKERPLSNFVHSLYPIGIIYIFSLFPISLNLLLSIDALCIVIVYTIVFRDLGTYIPRKSVRLIICIALYCLWVLINSIVRPLSSTPIEPIRLSSEFSSFGPSYTYNIQYNTIKAQKQEWKIQGEPKEVKPEEKAFGVSKLVWESHLQVYFNKDFSEQSFYSFHPELLKFRNSDEGWVQWDDLGVTSEFNIKTIRVIEGTNNLEFELTGIQKITPKENSKLNAAITKNFSINTVLYKKVTPKPNWCIYYIRNNKLPVK